MGDLFLLRETYRDICQKFEPNMIVYFQPIVMIIQTANLRDSDAVTVEPKDVTECVDPRLR